MIGLILMIALVGVLVWLLITFVPMPQQFRTLIIVVAVILVVLYILAAFGLLGDGLYVPRIRTGP